MAAEGHASGVPPTNPISSDDAVSIQTAVDSGSEDESHDLGAGVNLAAPASSHAAMAWPASAPRRIRFSPAAVHGLKTGFRAHVANPYPTSAEVAELGVALHLSESQITNGFTDARKRRGWQHPTDPSRNLLADYRLPGR